MKKADKIYYIVLLLGGRASLEKVKDILCIAYDKKLTNASVASTIRSDNLRQKNNGLKPRFKTYQKGESRGYVSLL